MEEDNLYIIHRSFLNSEGTKVKYTIETKERLPEEFKEELIKLVDKYTSGPKS